MRLEVAKNTDGQLLWRSLSRASTELLASNLALLEETRFFTVLGKKAQSLWKRDGDEFARTLTVRTAELNKLPREGLVLKLLGKLQEMAQLSPINYVSQRDLVDTCQQISAQALTYQHDADKDFSGETLEDLISYQMQRILGELKEKFTDLDIDQQNEIVEKLQEFLDKLPDEQQEEIRKQLGADELTKEVIRDAIITGTLSIAFAALVNALGFSFYMGAVSVLAVIAGLAGLTLPFAAYTTLTSAIAIMVDPVTIAAIFITMLTFGWWRSEKNLRETVLPLIVVQLAGAQPAISSDLPDQVGWKVLKTWYEALLAVESARDKLLRLNTQHENLLSERGQAQAVLKACKKKYRNHKKNLKANWKRVQELVPERLKEIIAGDWGSDLKNQGKLLQDIRQEQEVASETDNSGTWLDKTRDSVTGRWEIFKDNRNFYSVAKATVEILQQRDCFEGVSDPVLLDLLSGIEASQVQLTNADDQVRRAEGILTQVRDRLAAHDKETAAAKEKLKATEQAYLGLKAVAAMPYVFPLVLPEKPPELVQKAQHYLAQPMLEKSEDGRLRRMLTGGQGDISFAGLIVSDFIYDYARLDPTVIEAADFARAADIGDPLSFAAFGVEQSALEGASEIGMISQLQGYVAERLVAQHMSAAGYDVSFPENSNQPGWDVLIDGEPFQIKCGSSSSLVYNHFEKYPDIPVIVNRELSDTLGGLPGVYIDEELSFEHVRSMTEAGLAQGEELADFELPLISLTVSAAIEVRSLLRGQGALDAAIINVLTNTGGRIAGGVAGQATGSAVGVLLFGPAGGIIGGLVGTVGGGISGRQLARNARRLMAGDKAVAVRVASQNLASKAASFMPEKLSVWSAKQEKLSALSLSPGSDGEQLQRHLIWRMRDQGLYLDKCGKQLAALASEKSGGDPVNFAKQILSLVKRATLHPHLLQAELKELFDAVNAYMEKLTNYRADG